MFSPPRKNIKENGEPRDAGVPQGRVGALLKGGVTVQNVREGKGGGRDRGSTLPISCVCAVSHRHISLVGGRSGIVVQ